MHSSFSLARRLSFRLAVIMGGFGVFSALAKSEEKPDYVFAEIGVTASLRFDGNNPDETPELLATFRDYSRRAAELGCERLLGEPTLLQRTHEEQLSGSILRLTLETTWLCARSVATPAQIVPSLMRSLEQSVPQIDDTVDGLGFSAAADLDESARKLLLESGDAAANALLAVAVDTNATRGFREDALEVIGSFLQGSGSLSHDVFLGLLSGLLPVLEFDQSDTDSLMIAYEAGRAFANFYGAYHYALELRPRLSPLAYAALVYRISDVWRLGSSYEVRVGELASLLEGQDALVISYAVAAIQSRGLNAQELARLLPLFGPLLQPASPLRQSGLFAVLRAQPDASHLSLVLPSIDARLLGELQDRNYLFQALVALRDLASYDGAAAALPALRLIAASVDPDHRHLSAIAREIVVAIDAG